MPLLMSEMEEASLLGVGGMALNRSRQAFQERFKVAGLLLRQTDGLTFRPSLVVMCELGVSDRRSR